MTYKEVVDQIELEDISSYLTETNCPAIILFEFISNDYVFGRIINYDKSSIQIECSYNLNDFNFKSWTETYELFFIKSFEEIFDWDYEEKKREMRLKYYLISKENNKTFKNDQSLILKKIETLELPNGDIIEKPSNSNIFWKLLFILCPFIFVMGCLHIEGWYGVALVFGIFALISSGIRR